MSKKIIYGSRDESKDINLETPRATDLWSNGSTIWVAGNWFTDERSEILAYDLETKERDYEKDFKLYYRNNNPHGIASNGELIFICEDNLYNKNKFRVYVYDYHSKKRQTKKEFYIPCEGFFYNKEVCYVQSKLILLNYYGDDEQSVIAVYGALGDNAGKFIKKIPLHKDNFNPSGIWSNNTTIFVGDNYYNRIFCYSLKTEKRNKRMEFMLTNRSFATRGIWSNNKTMWILNHTDPIAVAYHLTGDKPK